MATVWKVTDLSLVRESSTGTTVLAIWKFNTGSTTDHFNLWWEYWNDEQRMWLLGVDQAVSVATAHYEDNWFHMTWSPPSDPHATLVRVCIDPVPTSGSKWKHGYRYSKSIPNPSWQDAHGEALDAPSISAEREIDGRIIVSWDEPPALAASIVFYQEDDQSLSFNRLREFPAEGTLDIDGSTVGRFFSIRPQDGHTYRWTAKWCLADKKTLGLMSEETDLFEARPLAPTNLTARATSGESVRLDWDDHGSSGASWRAEYDTSPTVWDNHGEPDGTYEHEVGPDADGHNWCEIDGLESGTTYWFRLVRVSEEAGDSDWATSGSSVQVSCVAGSEPEAPTLGAVPSCAPIDEPLRLSWTHNSTDSSSQTHYEVEITAGGTTTTLRGTTASSVTITPSSYSVTDGSSITWRVRTQGATEQWATDGGWSQTGTIIVWAKPASTVTAPSTMTEYPLELELSIGATAQANAPTRMWLSIVCASGHRETMPDGTERWVPEGELVWEGEAVPGQPGCTVSGFAVSLSAAEVILESGQYYEVRGGCMTAQGMVSEATPALMDCEISASDVTGCDCTATLDRETLSATIYPTCTDGPEGQLVSDVVLAVWKVTPDGVELVASGLPNDGTVSCVDRHPSFGSCTYRVVATDITNGGQGHSDATFSWKAPGIVIQWDEGWAEPSNDSDGISYSGQRLVLPYNIDISEQWDKESSLNMWAGNRHPVSRYGTQVGHTATWACVLNKFSNDGGLDSVRRLAEYMGDVHVREPYGSSYMAHIQVAIQETHATAAIPVTFSVTRVEE